jgi:hypothetical protein
VGSAVSRRTSICGIVEHFQQYRFFRVANAFFVSLIKKRKTTERLTVGVADNEAGDVLVDRPG